VIDLSKIDKKSLAKVFDYSVLGKEATEEDIRKGCQLAKEYGVAAFYASSAYWAPVIKEELAGTDIGIGTGIGFAWGTQPASVKAFEAEDAVKQGCTELDLCLNVGAIKDHRWNIIREELELFTKAAAPAITKAILEVCFLTNEEIATVCKLIAETGVQFAKTSTGQFEGPTLEQFMIMRETLKGTDVKLKVAGVKFPRPQNAFVFLLAGADRIGTRAAPEIIDSLELLRKIGMVPKLVCS
jgi:deoxyribose-phosphate aldolase